MEDQNDLPTCHFQCDGKMLDIKSEKIQTGEAEKIKVTVMTDHLMTSQGEDSDTSVRVFELENGLEDRINSFICEYVIEMFEL